MCGIVGHLGPENSVEYVIKGLERLEYRGYDSAGISYIDEKGILRVIKKSGKIENLKNELKGKNLVARSCIGHTRWATHGQVNDTNSHPHNDDKISLVHNGIIENYDELREELRGKGVSFESDTDSEVFLRMITHAILEGDSFFQAVSKSLQKIKGNSAFVILNSEENEIMAVKKGAPLVCGINDVGSEVFVSSDPYALVGLVNKLYFPEDDVICHLSGKNKNLLNFYEFDGSTSKRYQSKKQSVREEEADKGSYEHFMLKEIYEQPELIRSLTQYYFDGEGEESLERVASLKPERVCISACGTAYYAGLVIRDFIESLCRVPCATELASEFRYRNPILGKGDLGLFISQSGETADTLSAQKLCKEQGLKTASIVNVDGSSLFRECDENLLIRAGIEIGVASTKAYTQMCLTGYLLASAMSGRLDIDKQKHSIVEKFSLLASRVEELLANVDKIKSIAEEVYNNKGYFFTGRGIYFPVALEGALKLKEIAYVHAEGYASGELKHGPIAMIDEEMVNVAICGPELAEKTISNIQEIRARKGIIVSFAPEGMDSLKKDSDFFLPLNFEGLDELAPIYVNVANQLFAYHMAKFKGTDIDKPRNLAKSVTVE